MKPVLFKLVDLQGAPLRGHYYREQLTKSPHPGEVEYFFIEKILKSRTRKGKKEFLVKYLFYPNKFNKWIPEQNIVTKDQ